VNHFRCDLLDESTSTLYVGHGETEEKARRDALRVAFLRSDQRRGLEDFTVKESVQRGPAPRIADRQKEDKAKKTRKEKLDKPKKKATKKAGGS
jgi:hypothetical protein